MLGKNKFLKKLTAYLSILLLFLGILVPTVGIAADDTSTTGNAGTAQTAKGTRYTADTTALDKLVESAKKADVKVNVTHSTVITTADKVKKQVDDATTKQNTQAADETKKLTDYQKALSDYNDSVKGQLDDANPSDPLQPKVLAYEQPFTINDNRNSLQAINPDYDGGENSQNDYNSDKTFGIKINSDASGSYSFNWNNVATDKQSGRQLNAKITLSDGQASTNTDGAPGGFVYTNYVDNVGIGGITAMKETLNYTYADNGKAYDKKFYWTIGSLNFQDGIRAEYTAPDKGVIATFMNKDTILEPTLQQLFGTATKKVQKGFAGKIGTAQPGISDESPDSITKEGVTYLVNNGASIWVGESGVAEGQEPQGNADLHSTFNHIMTAADTIAPTAVQPVAPELNVDYQDFEVPGVAKDVQAGTTDGSVDNPSINNQEVKNGDELTYTLEGSDLPANRVTKLDSDKWTDKLPDGVKFVDAKAYTSDGKDDSDNWDITNDGQNVSATAKEDYLSLANKDMTKAFSRDRIVIHVKVTADGAELLNTGINSPNGDNITTNTVKNTTPKPDEPKPETPENLQTTSANMSIFEKILNKLENLI